MATYVMRVWMPDRPGALGAVASRIGAARGDVVGIEILERGAGRAIDELAIELADESLVKLLVAEVQHVDGVDVEFVRPVDGHQHDPRLDAVETAAMLVSANTAPGLLDALCEHGSRLLGTQWAVVIDLDGAGLHASVGDAPPVAWVAAFVSGSRTSSRVAAMEAGPDDVLWAPLPGSDLGLVMGRDGSPFRSRERRTVAALARIVDTRYRELAARDTRAVHPSRPAGPGRPVFRVTGS